MAKKKEKKKAKLSKNEKAAAKAGVSLKEYKKSKSSKKDDKKDKKDKKKSSSSKDEEKAKAQTETYYEEKKGFTQEEKDIQIKKIQEDLNNVIADTGITRTRALEDYVANVGNIESNRALDNKTLADYVASERGKTTEDLATSLAKESRRYVLEVEQINQDLADKGLTFSERTPEQIARGTSAQNVSDIQTEANRSFADIARYEAVKTAETALKYGKQTEEEGTKKTRTLEDVIADQEKTQRAAALQTSAVDLGLKESLSDISYQKSDKLSDISNLYSEQANSLKSEQDLILNI